MKCSLCVVRHESQKCNGKKRVSPRTALKADLNEAINMIQQSYEYKWLTEGTACDLERGGQPLAMKQ